MSKLKNIPGRRVAVIAVPFTFAGAPLCPLEQVSIETLRFISYLKAGGKRVSFINMRSKERFLWKSRKGGLTSGAEIRTALCSKPQEFLEAELLKGRPEEVLLWCDLPFSPYTFDLDVIAALKKLCLKALPGAHVLTGGAFWEIFPGQAARAGFELFSLEKDAADAYPPDFGAIAGEPYGLFQLAKGCSNNCSFCAAGRSRPGKFDNAATLRQLRTQAASGVKDFWNWDENVLMFPDHLEKFLDRYLRSGIKGTLNFSLGFQPDRISAGLIRKLGALRLGILTIPFETGTSASFRRVGKPYTIITSIKRVFEINRYAKKAIKRLHGTFIIGYPHDDFRSIFRIYLSILRLRAIPIPFPLYLFPGTGEYRQNAGALKARGLTGLHGQLWPLIPDKRVPEYINLLKFLSIDSLQRAKGNLKLLSPEMLSAFNRELRVNDAFVDKCLAASSDGGEELEKIEKELSAPASRRQRLLHICASPRPGGTSVSKGLGEYFCDKYSRAFPGGVVTRLDLAGEPIEFINAEYTDFIAHKVEFSALAERTRRLVALTDKYISLLRRADRIVISTPMYTLSIPAVLKAFFEMVASRLFYELNDKLEPRKICCVLSRDGMYGEAGEMHSVQEDSLSTALQFIGLKGEMRFVCAQGLGIGREAVVPAAKKELLRQVEWFHEELPGRAW